MECGGVCRFPLWVPDTVGARHGCTWKLQVQGAGAVTQVTAGQAMVTALLSLMRGILPLIFSVGLEVNDFICTAEFKSSNFSLLYRLL